MKTKLLICIVLALFGVTGVAIGAKRIDSYSDSHQDTVVGTAASTWTSAGYPITNLPHDQNYDGVIASFYMANMTPINTIVGGGVTDTAIITTYTLRGRWRDTLGVDTMMLPGYVVQEYWTDDPSSGGVDSTDGDSLVWPTEGTKTWVPGDGVQNGMFNDMLYFDFSVEDSAMDAATDSASWLLYYEFRLIEKK